MLAKIWKIAKIIITVVAAACLAFSYCLFIYMFVTDGTFLDNWISRLAAIVNVLGVFSAASFWKFLKDKFPFSLWAIAFVVSVATGFQALALLPLHEINVTVELIGAERKALATDLKVSLLNAATDLKDLDPDSTTPEHSIVFKSQGGVLVWNRKDTVVAVDVRTGVTDSIPIAWDGVSIWDACGERQVSLQLKPNKAWVSIITTPPGAQLDLTAYSNRDTTYFLDHKDRTPCEITIGDRITIVASKKGFGTLHYNYGLERITGDTEIPITLQARSTEVMVKAYNMGMEPESTAYVIFDSVLTAHKAFEIFTRPWGNEHTVAAELVDNLGRVFRSKVKSVTLISDTVNQVKCVLEPERRID